MKLSDKLTFSFVNVKIRSQDAVAVSTSEFTISNIWNNIEPTSHLLYF